ncbi:hypothetical protein AMTR_s00044p00222620 [Amborella trichopoda]|uniref:Uncharacterized protein n=1 Tax=Amborella trichopoda TaxID=13333 RepID=U5CVB3_AMBTC|nr:hypothetical protein AMTR_s00044p00222620 [Amborella trichopoda]
MSFSEKSPPSSDTTVSVHVEQQTVMGIETIRSPSMEGMEAEGYHPDGMDCFEKVPLKSSLSFLRDAMHDLVRLPPPHSPSFLI